MSNTPIIDALTKNRPIIGAILKGGKEIVAERLQHATDMPPASVDAVAGDKTLTEIAANPAVVLTGVKPMSRKWSWSVLGGAIVGVINAGAPLLGITPDGPLTDAVEQLFQALGARPGIGSAVLYLAFGGGAAGIWIWKRWFSHTVTPAAADRAVANGKAV